MPNSAEAEFFIGRIAFARGRTPDALTHFDRAVSLDGTRGEFHLYVARATFDMGNLGRTVDEVATAINFDPNLGDAFWVRAMVRLRMGAVKDALADLTKALKLNPARVDAYAVQGDCYEQLRQLPDAIRSYRIALDRDSSRAEWWYRQATLEAQAGLRGDSDGHVKRAIDLGDKLETMPVWLPEAYGMAGENAEARGDRTTAIRLFKRYMQIAQPNAIDRSEIERKLKGWGVQLEEEEQ
jgi:superkiller protein 3